MKLTRKKSITLLFNQAARLSNVVKFSSCDLHARQSYQLQKNPAIAQHGGQPESEPKDFLKEAATEPPLSGRVIKEGQAGLVLFAR